MIEKFIHSILCCAQWHDENRQDGRTRASMRSSCCILEYMERKGRKKERDNSNHLKPWIASSSSSFLSFPCKQRAGETERERERERESEPVYRQPQQLQGEYFPSLSPGGIRKSSEQVRAVWRSLLLSLVAGCQNRAGVCSWGKNFFFLSLSLPPPDGSN